MRYVIEVFRSPGGVHGNVVGEGCAEADGGPGHRTPFHGWLELLSLLEPPPDPASTEPGERACAAGDDSCDA
ncbi:hypothetical protein OG302_35815 [Streptomyces sp. NBC_01283]|uniref:hypothetical protein n=1 Tax=Streptomyces sp. NBC_01283 TaxID=2903812 RepID=UPI00352C2358|nr:hypothetical protein OG302_35815 [Streptomyces sp. NBC_01283]